MLHTPGTYPIDQAAMPYPPEELHIPRYILPETYGNAEKEWAAARLIVAYQELAQGWCGISLPTFFSRIVVEERHCRQLSVERDAIIEQRWAAIRPAIMEDKSTYQRQVTRFKRMNLSTAGLYGRFKSRPVAPAIRRPDFDDLPPLDIPYGSGFPGMGDMITTGLAQLRDKGFIRVEHNEEAGHDVIYPTPKLLEPLDRYRLQSA